MKSYLRSVAAIAGLALFSALNVLAEDAATTTDAPKLSYGVADVLKLSQAKVSDDTIVSYIKNSGRAYSDLNASEIVYLHQQGVSDRVVNSMLDQRTTLTSSPAPTVTTTAQTDSSAQYQQPAAQPTATVATAPVVTAPLVYTQPASTVYVIHDNSPRLVDYGYYPYYPAYRSSYYYYPYFPSVSFGFRFGGGGHSSFHGGGFHGGGHGGFHH